MKDTGGRAKRHVFRGMLAGAAGGFVASYVMNQFQACLSKATEKQPASRQPQQQAQSQKQKEKPDDATEKTADAISTALTGKHLGKSAKSFYGPVVHYAFGSAMGAIYGAAVEGSPSVRAGYGTFFGSALFAGADGIAVPALGLSQSAARQPAEALLFPWLSHVVYGATVELVRGGMRAIL